MSKWAGMLEKINVHSFRIRILLGFLLVSATTIGIAALGFWYQKQSTKLSQVRILGENVRLDLLRMQKAEAEFDSDGLVSRPFFETGLHSTLSDHAASHANIHNCLLLLLEALPKAMHSDQEAGFQGKVDSMLVGLAELQNHFQDYANRIRQRGFLSFGIMGEMREIAHILESSGRFNSVQLLQMRRHEKDYLLRRDSTYYNNACQVGANLLYSLPNGQSSATEQALLGKYLERFAELVALERELGWTGGPGLRQKIKGVSKVLGNQVKDLNAALSEESTDLGVRYQRIFLAIAGLAILLTIGLSLYFSIKISDPLQSIMRFIRTEISQQFQPSTNRLAIKGRGEIRDLSNDINAMVRQIRRQLGEIKAQGETLADRNSALMELNAELRETHEQQAAMLHVREKVHSIISHDLRAPINGMIGYLNLLLETPDDFEADDIALFARQMLQSTLRLSEMMENLLRWSLFHSGELVSNPQALHLNTQVQRAIELYAEVATKKEVTLVNAIDNDWTVFVDKDMLDFILRNLISNAIKFTKPGGTVEVAAKPETDAFLSIQVKDNGVGMTMDQVNRILEKGEHVTMTGTQREKGTGFGLMLCRDFVVHQGGKLTVQSSVGVGTEVSFTLPRLQQGE
ncbi:MAG: hypothetical protein RLZZ519_1818 [Bacteroidota bacterium]|jgi:signal transduction histidine kinase